MVISAPDVRAWAPPCPLAPKLVLAPVDSPQAVLQATSPTATLPVNLPVLQETHSWSGRSPTTQAQCAALVIASMMEFPNAVKERVTDVLVVGSTCLKPYCKKVVTYPFRPFPLSLPKFWHYREELVEA